MSGAGRSRDDGARRKRMASKKPRTRSYLARTFLRLCATGKVREAYERFAAPDFRHHNPYFRGDAASLRAGMEEAAAKFPHTTIETQRSFEAGNLVAVHSKVRHEAAGRDIAVVHIFRFKGSRIVELWDIAMEAPADSPNEHGLF
jgi:predicted SnoaL-like aldol condensation-catalyzing enzyme